MPPWYTRPFTLEAQAEVDATAALVRMLEALAADETGFLVVHPGYVDAEVLDLRTFSIVRARDLQAVCAGEVRDAITRFSVELVTYADLF